QWRPIDDIVWDIENTAARTGVYAVYGLGWLTVLAGTLMIKRLGRHPLYLGWSMVFWATPTMTAAHLLFAIATTSYVLVAMQVEEWLAETGYAVSFRRNQAWANRRSWRTMWTDSPSASAVSSAVMPPKYFISINRTRFSSSAASSLMASSSLTNSNSSTPFPLLTSRLVGSRETLSPAERF